MLKSLRELWDHKPFQAFRIVVSSGDKYEVINRYNLALGESQLLYCYPHLDRFAYIQLS